MSREVISNHFCRKKAQKNTKINAPFWHLLEDGPELISLQRESFYLGTGLLV